MHCLGGNNVVVPMFRHPTHGVLCCTVKLLNLWQWVANIRTKPRFPKVEAHLSRSSPHQVGKVRIHFFHFCSSRYVCKGKRKLWCCPWWYPLNDRRCKKCNRLYLISLVRSNRYLHRILCTMFRLCRLGIDRLGMPSKCPWHCRICLNRTHYKTF